MTPEQAHANIHSICAELLAIVPPVAKELYSQVLKQSLDVLKPVAAEGPAPKSAKAK